LQVVGLDTQSPAIAARTCKAQMYGLGASVHDCHMRHAARHAARVSLSCFMCRLLRKMHVRPV
jgi:hypothetical protein